MKAINYSYKQVSQSRPNYYRLWINNKEVAEFRFPANNPFLKHLNIDQLAKHEAERIANS